MKDRAKLRDHVNKIRELAKSIRSMKRLPKAAQSGLDSLIAESLALERDVTQADTRKLALAAVSGCYEFLRRAAGVIRMIMAAFRGHNGN